MQSKASTVTEYLQTVPPERIEAMTRLRELCCSTLDGYDEGIQYGMPSYSRGGVVEVGFNSQKNYISLYILNKEVLDRYRHLLGDVGKGCIRYRKPSQIEFQLVERILKDAAASSAPICP